MPRLGVSHSFKLKSNPVRLLCVLLGLLVIHTHAKDALPVPQQVSLSPNLYKQQLSISWLGGAATTFDLMILRTELNETAFYETVSATINQESGHHQWNWTSVEPLECTSLSIKIRSRDGQTTSEWSDTQILQGNDIPSNEKFQMYPQDRIVPVGANTTFCCIVEEGMVFGSIHYSVMVMNTIRLSRRTYAITALNQEPSDRTGTNVFCSDNLKTKFVERWCLLETRDLTSAVCRWNEGRDTRLYGKQRRTQYSLNMRYHIHTGKECSVDKWEDNWTLVAVNPLGQYSLSDSAELTHRVRPVAPANVTTVVNAWNATVLWQWKYESYSSLALVCQVELTSQESKTKRTSSGVGLRSVVLSDLYPDEDYSIQVRCGAQKNFWKWGNWSEPLAFKTNTDVPDVPDVWFWINKDNTGQVIWKPLTRRQSHGQITGYEVTLWTSDENIQHTDIFPAETSAAPINLTQIAAFSVDTKVTATVIAKNNKGVSQPASVLIPLHLTVCLLAVYTDRGFPLYWQGDANATCGYVVEWFDAFCSKNCLVEWIKVSAGLNNVFIESASFKPGVRYNFSLYSCSSEAPELLQRWQGYMQELVPSSSVSLLTSQQDFNVVLTWGEIPLVDIRGFLLGYNVYMSNGPQLTLLVFNPSVCLQGPLDVKSSPHSMVHIVERPEWDSSKEALVVIPEEDEDEEGQGIGEEPVDTDEPTSLRYYNQVVDERPIRPRFPDSSDSSASSLDSARTDVTYTGIQTSGSSLVFQLDPQGSSDTHRPLADLPVSCGGGGGGYRPQMQSRAHNDGFDLASPEPFQEPQGASSGGYKPQCSWHLDSPEDSGESAGLAPSLGSPTSVASTQFLLPDGEKHTEEKKHLSSSPATWFTNLLSSTKP
uniref:LIF receptor subunit alpha a n=1 Tax=Labrus bergylta TaxID=56723 RepID=A0A3Q3FDT9_9LABR